MGTMNRLATSGNPYQGREKRVLTVCSAGLLRSPTAAFVLASEPYGYNTRAAGIAEEYALIPVDGVLLHWAEEIVCMEEIHLKEIGRLFPASELRSVRVLDIPDTYGRMDPELVRLIREAYGEPAA